MAAGEQGGTDLWGVKPAQHCLGWTRGERLRGPGTVPRVAGCEGEGVYGEVAVGEAKWPTSHHSAEWGTGTADVLEHIYQPGSSAGASESS